MRTGDAHPGDRRRGGKGLRTTDCVRFHPSSSGFIRGLIPSGLSFNAAFRLHPERMQSPSPAVARCALPWVTRPGHSPNPVRVSSLAPSYATISTSLGLGGRRRQMLQPLSGLAGFLGALPGVGPPPTAPAVQPRANCCNPFGIGGAGGTSRREEIGERRGKREDRRSERDRRDHGLQTAGSSVFIRFYLWFNSFRAFLLTQRRRGSQRFAEGFSSLRFSALSLRLGVKNGAFGWGRIRTRMKVGDRREEIGEREKGPREHGPRTALLPAVSSVFIRFYPWFNSFRAFFPATHHTATE